MKLKVYSILVSVLVLFLLFEKINDNKYFNFALDKLGVEKDYSSMPKFEKGAIDAWTNSIKSINDSFDIAFFGHSQIQFADFRDSFKEYKTINLGFGSCDLERLILRKEQIKFTHPKKIVFLAGINSVYYSAKKFENKYRKLVDGIILDNSDAEIIVINILPTSGKLHAESIKEKNRFILEYCKEKKLKLVNMYNEFVNDDGFIKENLTIDGIHLNDKGYKIFYRIIKENL